MSNNFLESSAINAMSSARQSSAQVGGGSAFFVVMNKTRILLLLAILTFHTQSGSAQSALIWSRDDMIEGGGIALLITNENLYFGPGHLGPGFGPISTNFLFQGLYFSAQDVGRVFAVSSEADDPNFGYVVSALTDGVDQDFSFLLMYEGLNTYKESQLFAGIGTGPDLIGYDIHAITLTVDSFDFVSPGTDPNHDGIWTDMSAQVTVSIYGYAVPEPGTWSLLCLGVPCGLVFLRWRRHQQPSRLHPACRQRIAG